MLAVILAVTTYMFYRSSEESDIKLKDGLAKLDKATKLALKNEDDANELKRLIGTGGMGIVYAATQLELDRRVAPACLSVITRRGLPLLDHPTRLLASGRQGLSCRVVSILNG